jgi:hypothetical protein
MVRAALIGAAMLAGILAPQASAHDAAAVCDTQTGTYVIYTDFQEANPTWTFTDATVVVTWDDGFTVTRPLPMPCVPPPPPPPIVIVRPAPAPAPAVVEEMPVKLPGRPDRPRVKKQPHAKRVITCSFVVRHYKGAARARMVARHKLPKTCGRPFNPPVAG